MRRLTLLLTIAAPLWLAGCDMLGIESASAAAAKQETVDSLRQRIAQLEVQLASTPAQG